MKIKLIETVDYFQKPRSEFNEEELKESRKRAFTRMFERLKWIKREHLIPYVFATPRDCRTDMTREWGMDHYTTHHPGSYWEEVQVEIEDNDVNWKPEV